MFFAKEGFVLVSLGWIVLSFFGCMPFWLSGEIPHFIDALFEIVSGFTTTGASIVPKVEELSKATLMWRSFSHWIGGMGILVFILSILPMTGDYNMHIMRGRKPRPFCGKAGAKNPHYSKASVPDLLFYDHCYHGLSAHWQDACI